jgi:hypothetical protein
MAGSLGYRAEQTANSPQTKRWERRPASAIRATPYNNTITRESTMENDKVVNERQRREERMLPVRYRNSRHIPDAAQLLPRVVHLISSSFSGAFQGLFTCRNCHK